MPGIVSKPAQFSYQTGTPIEGEDRNKALKTDFAGQIDSLNSKIPGMVPDHIKRQKAIAMAQGQQVLAMGRGGGILKGYKQGSTT